MDNCIFTHPYEHDSEFLKPILPPKNERYIIIDTETTGLNVNQENIIELAAVEVKNGKITGRQFHIYIKPRKKIEPKALELHKMGNDFYKLYYENTFESENRLLKNFLDFLGTAKIFAHNSDFDKKFINKELSYQNLPLIDENRFFCTMKLFQQLVTGEDSKPSRLTSCCEHLNLKSNPLNSFHSALFDAFMTSRLVCKLWELEEKELRNVSKKQKIEVSYVKGSGQVQTKVNSNEVNIFTSPTTNINNNNIINSKEVVNNKENENNKESGLNKPKFTTNLEALGLKNDPIFIYSEKGSKGKNNQNKDYEKRIESKDSVFSSAVSTGVNTQKERQSIQSNKDINSNEKDNEIKMQIEKDKAFEEFINELVMDIDIETLKSQEKDPLHNQQSMDKNKENINLEKISDNKENLNTKEKENNLKKDLSKASKLQYLDYDVLQKYIDDNESMFNDLSPISKKKFTESTFNSIISNKNKINHNNNLVNSVSSSQIELMRNFYQKSQQLVKSNSNQNSKHINSSLK